MTEKFEKEVIEKLDIMIKLFSQSSLDPDAPQTEAIQRLSKIGLKPSQIAEVLNTTGNYVNVILSKNRKEASKNG